MGCASQIAPPLPLLRSSNIIVYDSYNSGV